MTKSVSRRLMLGLITAGSAGFIPKSPAIAQSAGQGLLARLRKEGIAKVGIVNGMPYSMLNPDGSVDGVAPTIVKLCLERLGIPKIEAIVSTYGALIPGMQAGRWDLIGADMTITKTRCEQVAYFDPFTIDSAAFAYVPGNVPNPPKTLKEVGASSMKIGMLAGTYMQPIVKERGVKQEDISIFPDLAAELESLLQKRIQLAFAGSTSLRDLRASRNNAYNVVYPIPDDVLHGASGAVRPGDTDLLEAFQAEYRKMKKSGEAKTIVNKFGWDFPDFQVDLTAVQACSESHI